MPLQLKVKDMMVSIDDYAVTTADKPLNEAIPELMKIYFRWKPGNVRKQDTEQALCWMLRINLWVFSILKAS